MITCKEGTTIKIKANSFISEKTGKEISGNIQLAVKEHYQISDIILAKLSTTSGNNILETGGMLNLMASANSENCNIKHGENIEIGFPYSNKKDDMELFYGEWTNNKIDWKQARKPQQEVNKEVFFIVEEMPEFPGGDAALRKYISDNLKYPVDIAKNGLGGKVIVTFNIDKDGNINDARIIRGVNPLLDKEALRIINSFPKWKPGKQRGKPVCVSYTVPVYFDLKSAKLTKKEFEEQLSNNSKEINMADVNRYFFDVSQLGWINCDRFKNDLNPLINFSIYIKEPEKTVVNLVFNRFKSVIPGNFQTDRIIFNNIPINEKVTIIAFKTKEDKVLLSIKETTISTTEETILDFQPVTMDLLKSTLKKLNNQ